MSLDLVAHRNAKTAASPVMLRGAYRLSFLGGAVWALVVVSLWIASYAGTIVEKRMASRAASHQPAKKATGAPAKAGRPVQFGTAADRKPAMTAPR